MNIYFDTVGCRLNQAEIERMAAEFRLAGHTIIDTPKNADLVVVNSCAVTAAAASDSRAKVRQAARMGAQRIVLTGCWSTIAPQQARDLPGVSEVISNEDKDDLVKKILGQEIPMYEIEPVERQPLPGAHRRTRAFIKVQDGCDNLCTFCITRVARGASRSITQEEILSEVRSAEAGGSHEIVLSGVNLGSWGQDFIEGNRLTDLIRYLLAQSSIERVRLSSIEPWDMDDDFLALWGEDRMCRHLHIPLQSGCAATLKRMGRKTTPDLFRGLLRRVREAIPGVAITTDLIVGFAGETEAEFAESLAFVQEMGFAGGHVFRFSPREGTPAFVLPGRVNGFTAHRRSEQMRQILADSQQCYWQHHLGQTLEVLWESSRQSKNGKWVLHGLTRNYLPVTVSGTEDRWNKIDSVKITHITQDTLEGILL